jgi:2-dehydro-3-deoxyphosphogluconate aldolase / (4S)-4-hydroxy-2-oxoglutarate aldolase
MIQAREGDPPEPFFLPATPVCAQPSGIAHVSAVHTSPSSQARQGRAPAQPAPLMAAGGCWLMIGTDRAKGEGRMTAEDAVDPTLATIHRGGVVAIVRGSFLRVLPAVLGALREGGVTALEISLASPEALPQIERAVGSAPPDMAIGAGTVLTPEDVRRVHEAGARFIVSPVVDVEVVAAARSLGLVVIPGAFTPTEALAAVRAGAPAVKLFPADTLGPGYVRSLLAPLPDLRLVPTGGVTLALAREFAAAGAWAVGVGTPLVGKDPARIDGLTERAREFVTAMRC